MNLIQKTALATIFAFAGLLSTPFGNAQNTIIQGDWKGILKFNQTSLPLIFHFQESEDGILATMDSADQGAFGIKVDSVFSEDRSIYIEINSLMLSYQGKLSDSITIEGSFSQGMLQEIPLVLSKTYETTPRPLRPQEPQPPFDYTIEEVEFRNEKADITLSGTLTLPKNGDNLKVVILISGSGPNERDEEIEGHKPFLIIADHLTRNNIAVLRYDDRGVGKSTGNFSEATTLDFAEDVNAAVEFLKNQERLDPEKIGLIGHSEGGMVAPVVASQSKDIAYLILLAAPGTTGRQVFEDQTRLIAEASGIPQAFTEKSIDDLGKIVEAVLESESLEESERKITEFVNAELDNIPPEQLKAMGGRESRVNFTLQRYNSPWMKTFLAFDPSVYLKKVKSPVLALNGTLDLQVPYRQNLAAIKEALEKGKNKKFKLVPMDGLNHLFQHAKTGTPNEYGKIEETIAPQVLEIMTNWIKLQ